MSAFFFLNWFGFLLSNKVACLETPTISLADPRFGVALVVRGGRAPGLAVALTVFLSSSAQLDQEHVLLPLYSSSQATLRPLLQVS